MVVRRGIARVGGFVLNLIELLSAHAVGNPDQPALIDGSGRSLTFEQLEQASQRGAAQLLESGVGRGDGVMFAHPISIEVYVALLAAFRIGAVAVFFDPSAGREIIDAAVERTKPKAFFGGAKAHLLRLLKPSIRKIPVKFATVPGIPATHWLAGIVNSHQEIADCADDDPALITFTSGSTGLPKAVVRSHGFLLAQYRALSGAMDFQPGDVDLITLPVFTLANLAAGMTSVLANTDLAKPGAADAEAIDQQLQNDMVTRCAASPAFFVRLLEGNADLSRLTKIYTGGAPVFPPLLNQLTNAAPDAHVAAVYGSTEAEPIAHLDAADIAEADLGAMRTGDGLLAGVPVPEICLAIIPNTWGTPIESMTSDDFIDLQLPNETPGEIVVSGDHVLTGYLDGVGDEETKFRVDGKTWHRTGDAGRLDTLGRLWLLGRANAVIRDARGELYPFAVETALSFHESLRRSALIAHQDRRLLFIEGAADIDVSWAEIDETIPVPKIPVDKRHNAKIDYPALRKLAERSSVVA